MSPADLLAALETMTDAPGGIASLRDLILQLAMRGQLVSQDPSDEPANELCKRIAAQKARASVHRRGRKQKSLPPIAEDEIPHALPPSWEWVRLVDIAEYNTRPKVSPDDIDDDAWLLDLEDIEKTSSTLLYRARFSERSSRSTKSAFQGGDVLYGKLRPYLDKVLVADSPGVCTTEIVPITPFSGVSSEWLRWSLKRPGFRELVEGLSYGVKMPRLGTKDAQASLHPLAPAAEQHRIVTRIDELMALLDRLEAAKEARDATRAQLRDAALAALQDAEEAKTGWSRIADHIHDLFTDPADIPSLRQAILQLAVRGGLVRQDAIAARIVEVREVVQFLNGYAFKSTWYTDAGVRVVRNQNVSHNRIDWQDTKRVSEDRAREFDRFRLEEGDIVLSLDRPIISSGLKVATVRANDLPCLLLQRVACPRTRDASLSRRYFLVWLNSPDFIESIDPGRSNGVPHISTRAVEAMTLRLPSLDEQDRITSKVDELMAILDRLEASLLHASHLQAAFSVASTRTMTVSNSSADPTDTGRGKVGLAESISP